MDAQAFLTWCVVKRNLGKNSIKHTRIRYNYLFRWLQSQPLTQDTAESFILYLREKGLRNSTLNSYIRVINLIDIFERENANDLNLLKKISYFPKQKRIPTIMTFDEILALLNTDIVYKKKGARIDINKMYKNAWYIIASTGCRLEEALTLKVSDLSLGLNGDGSVTFRNTKNRMDRKVPLPPIVVYRLLEHIKDKKAEQYVFVTSLGNKVTAQTMEEDIKRRVYKAGINKHIYPHCFRNSYIMELLRRKCDPLTIAKLVGHEDVNSTLGYTKFDYDDLLSGAEHHPLFAKSLPPIKILQKIKETIETFRLDQDMRFDYRIEEGKNSLSVLLCVR